MRRRPRLTLIDAKSLQKIKRDSSLALFLAMISLGTVLAISIFILIKLS